MIRRPLSTQKNLKEGIGYIVATELRYRALLLRTDPLEPIVHHTHELINIR